MSVAGKHAKSAICAAVCAGLVAGGACIGMRTPLDDDVQAPRATDTDQTTRTADADTCGVEISLRTVHPVADVLIVLDRSTTMRWSLAQDASCGAEDPDCISRLAALTTAIGTLIADNSNIHWGLELFSTPDSPSCTVLPTPQVAVGANSGPAIRAEFASLTTGSSTPTTAALEVATAYLKTVNDGNRKAILLATDGVPTCTGLTRTRDDLAGAVAAASAAKEAGFPVYVIGIGPEIDNLNSLAEAGGTHDHYPATSTRELNDALASIARVVSLCTFKADEAPPNKDWVYVYVDKQRVPQDPENGWTFDTSDATCSTINLNGKACQDMLAGPTSTVEIVQYECPGRAPTGDGR